MQHYDIFIYLFFFNVMVIILVFILYSIRFNFLIFERLTFARIFHLMMTLHNMLHDVTDA